jgi:hypothetical protein
MALPKKKTAAATLNASPKSADRGLFDDFLPHLIARLASQLHPLANPGGACHG